MIDIATRWKKQTTLSMVLLLVVVAVLYFPVLQKLVGDWETNDNYSHGYFIPFLSAYMIYSMRHDLSRILVKPAFSGLFLLLAGLTQLVVAKVGSEFFLQRTSLLVVLAGLVLFCLGWAYMKKLLFPIIYLIFMIPLPAIIWNKIAFPLQLFGSYLTEKVVSFVGIPIFREGNVLHLAQTTLEVVDACSGLRSLVTMFALSAALAWFSTLWTWKKVVLFAAAAPIAIFANIIRLTTTALLASKYGSDVAQGFLHDFSGFVTFGVGLSLLIGVNALLSRGE